MSDQLNNMKEALIYEYLYNRPSGWTIQSMKRDLRKVLHEEPAINVHWVKSQRLNESTNLFEAVEVPTSITVYYTTETVVNGRITQVPGNITVMI
jgi:hypothetical protein